MNHFYFRKLSDERCVNFNKSQSATGAIMVEIALTIPLFLALVFLLIWFATYQNAAGSLSSGVFQSLRLALTRGTSDYTLIPDFEKLYDGTAPDVISIGLKNHFYSSNMDPLKAKNYYLNGVVEEDFLRFSSSGSECYANRQIGGATNRVPRPYIYALAYANTYMADAIGNSLKFPCNPHADDGGGCLSCYIEEPLETSGPWDCSNPTIPAIQFTLTCEYRPDSILYGAIAGILKISGSELTPVIIKRSARL